MDPKNPLRREIPNADLPQAILTFACDLAEYPHFEYWPLHLESMDSRVPLDALIEIRTRVADYGVELMLLLIRLQHADRYGLVDREDVAAIEPVVRALCDAADSTELFLMQEIDWRRAWAGEEAA